MKLTKFDRATIARAHTLKRTFGVGIFPGKGQHAHFNKLEHLGLLQFDGFGRDIDGKHEKDVPIYQLTATGWAAAEEES